MPKTRPPYSPEFRRQTVELVHAGRIPTELTRESEPTAQSISHWVAQADRQEGRQASRPRPSSRAAPARSSTFLQSSESPLRC
jgi:transposase-like protein